MSTVRTITATASSRAQAPRIEKQQDSVRRVLSPKYDLHSERYRYFHRFCDHMEIVRNSFQLQMHLRTALIQSAKLRFLQNCVTAHHACAVTSLVQAVDHVSCFVSQEYVSLAFACHCSVKDAIQTQG